MPSGTSRARVRIARVVVVVIAVLLASFPSPALADIVFTGNAQGFFGVDANGTNVDGQGTDEFTDALDKFRQTEEGQRIEKELDDADVEVTVEVLPDADVADGKAYGTARVTERDPETGKPTKILIKLASGDTGGVSNLADTLQHELRHAEIFLDDNDPAKHAALDDGHDHLNDQFVEQLRRLPTPTPTPTPSPHPNFDRIMQEAHEEEELARQARMLGDLLGDLVDSIQFNEPTPAFDETFVDIKAYGAFELTYTLEGVDVDFNESTFECGEASGARRVVCPAGVQPMPAGKVLAIGMVLANDVPQSDAEHSYIYSTVFDSDGDDANDWRPQPPFDWDYFQDTDRWYQLIWDHASGEWRLTATQLDTAGGQSSFASTARAVILGDTIVFFISAKEFPTELPGFRTSAFGHDGRFGEDTRGGDVSGENPTGQLTPPLAE